MGLAESPGLCEGCLPALWPSPAEADRRTSPPPVPVTVGRVMRGIPGAAGTAGVCGGLTPAVCCWAWQTGHRWLSPAN